MNVSPTLVRTVGHAWMGFTVSRACVQVRTLAHFAKVRKVAVVNSCILFLEFLYQQKSIQYRGHGLVVFLGVVQQIKVKEVKKCVFLLLFVVHRSDSDVLCKPLFSWPNQQRRVLHQSQRSNFQSKCFFCCFGSLYYLWPYWESLTGVLIVVRLHLKHFCYDPYMQFICSVNL